MLSLGVTRKRGLDGEVPRSWSLKQVLGSRAFLAEGDGVWGGGGLESPGRSDWGRGDKLQRIF